MGEIVDEIGVLGCQVPGFWFQGAAFRFRRFRSSSVLFLVHAWAAHARSARAPRERSQNLSPTIHATGFASERVGDPGAKPPG